MPQIHLASPTLQNMAPRPISAFTTHVRALVFANGEPPSRALFEQLRQGADLVVAADGGADKALALGVSVDAVVGDLDSVSDDARATLPADRFHRVAQLDTTDLQKAISFAIANGCDTVDVVAAGGGRADHALANLSVITLFRGKADIRINDDLFEVSLVEGRTVIESEPGTLISLIAIGTCHGVTTTGMRWNLTDFQLDFGPRGIHNEVATSPATVSVASGDLLLFRGRWVEKHR